MAQSDRSTPSRRSLLLSAPALVAAAAVSLPVPSETLAEPGTWAPTHLGQEFMRRLPAFAEATYVRCTMCDAKRAPGYDPVKLADANRAENKTDGLVKQAAKAILKRPPTEPAHLVDLAIVCAAWQPERLEDWEKEDRAYHALVGAILAMAGLSRDDCSINALYRAHEDLVAAGGLAVGGANA